MSKKPTNNNPRKRRAENMNIENGNGNGSANSHQNMHRTLHNLEAALMPNSTPLHRRINSAKPGSSVQKRESRNASLAASLILPPRHNIAPFLLDPRVRGVGAPPRPPTRGVGAPPRNLAREGGIAGRGGEAELTAQLSSLLLRGRPNSPRSSNGLPNKKRVRKNGNRSGRKNGNK